jgi:uncharacterized membrane protein SpoIIM required for sporulation/ABC-type transport system involved in cytochrome c biogenesis permease component
MKNRIRMMWMIARRELMDQLRDWRILGPMATLVLVFPFLMGFFTRVAVNFINQYGATLVSERFGPFMLMVAGFFPVTVSLVVALEAFVGEKERGSMEPLLSSPITDAEIYLGKLVAGSIVPLIAGYLSIFIYLFLLYRNGDQIPDVGLIIQVCVLNAVQAILMVSVAIVISTQSTSVRAANLLSSFIILPVGILIQGESYLIFWGSNDVLWVAVIGISILTSLFIRLGLSHFQREKLLGREIDVLDFKWLSRTFWLEFSGGQSVPAFIRFIFRRKPDWFAPDLAPVNLGLALLEDLRGIRAWYRVELPKTFKKIRPAIIISSLVGVAAMLGTFFYVDANLPQKQVTPMQLREVAVSIGAASPEVAPQDQANQLDAFQDLLTTPGLFVHNTRSALLISVLGFFSFGLVGYLGFMLNLGLVGGFMAVFRLIDLSPLLVFAAGILPHGIFEIPGLTLAVAAMLYATVRLVTPEQNHTIGEVFIGAIADWLKIFVAVCIPLFLLAAIVEANITPIILLELFGRLNIMPNG